MKDCIVSESEIVSNAEETTAEVYYAPYKMAVELINKIIKTLALIIVPALQQRLAR